MRADNFRHSICEELRCRRSNETFFIDKSVAVGDRWAETLSGLQLLNGACRLIECLRHARCAPGDAVLLFSEWHPDVLCVLLAGILGGFRVAFLPHTADLRELKHALHAVRPRLMFVGQETRSIALELQRLRHPEPIGRPQQIYVMGNEFLGRYELGSFNVFVRDTRVARIESISTAIGDAHDEEVIVFAFDRIGRFRADRLSVRDIASNGRRPAANDARCVMSFGADNGDESTVFSLESVRRAIGRIIGADVGDRSKL